MASVTVTVSLKDMASVKLLAIQLRLLADEMRVMASPHAERLEAILATFERGVTDGGPEDGA